jgi:hypothetical protein
MRTQGCKIESIGAGVKAFKMSQRYPLEAVIRSPVRQLEAALDGAGIAFDSRDPSYFSTR